MPTLEYEDDKVEELCDVTEEILEENGKGVINSFKFWLKNYTELLKLLLNAKFPVA
jgi:hypothetical protein